MTKSKREHYDVEDIDNSCSDPDCCGGPNPVFCVNLPVRGWRGYLSSYERAERMARLCKRWGVR